MASPVTEIIKAQYAPDTLTVLYTSQALTTRIDKLTITNQDGASAHTISLYLVPAGGSPGASNRTTNLRSIAPTDTWNSPNEYGHYLNPGDALACIADAAAQLVIAVGGTQVAG